MVNVYLRFIAVFLASVLPFFALKAQAPLQPSAARIKLDLNKLNFLGSVLYVAAHPDDENTRVIAYLSNGRLAATAYLSMTRGDGGQNLIGPEIGASLGLIRTQELLSARRIDGGRQFFTRAVDFGYSKSADETLRIWGAEHTLSDVVRVIRRFRPDVIVTRFPPDKRAGHGHHTASAMLAIEAFERAGDPSSFPDQVKTLGTWTPRRLYINTGRWWNSSINRHTPGVTTLDVGGYDPLLGTSYPEMAAQSRTQHKSQGFGSAGTRGELLEFLELKKGKSVQKDIFEGVDTTWARVPGGKAIQPLVSRLISEYDEEHPAASVPDLLEVRKKISALQAHVWKDRKLALVDRLIAACLGLYVTATADRAFAAPGEEVTCAIEMVNRVDVPVTLNAISGEGPSPAVSLPLTLSNNKPLKLSFSRRLERDAAYSTPYWLRKPHALGFFNVEDTTLIGKPENDPAITYTFSFSVADGAFSLAVPVVYRWVDPVKGERWRPFRIVPAVSVQFADPVILFPNRAAKKVDVRLKSYAQKPMSGSLRLNLPNGWRSEPSQAAFELSDPSAEHTVTFTVYPAADEGVFTLSATAEVEGRLYDKSLQVIDYDHIPTQISIYPAATQASRIDLAIADARIGYIKGAGDKTPEALRSMGYSVWEMTNDEVVPENLKSLDAVVVGIRAFNTNERIAFFMDDLLDYVKGGGTLIVQYNTNRRLKVSEDKMAPYPLSLSRTRVTDENSDVTMLATDHPVWHYPNTITPSDFEGWVQERGLYFPGRWDDRFVPLLSLHDPDEPAAKGALLVASYGQGHYVYTGISFFRQLPQGVPGAYKIFANLLALGKQKSR